MISNTNQIIVLELLQWDAAEKLCFYIHLGKQSKHIYVQIQVLFTGHNLSLIPCSRHVLTKSYWLSQAGDLLCLLSGLCLWHFIIFVCFFYWFDIFMVLLYLMLFRSIFFAGWGNRRIFRNKIVDRSIPWMFFKYCYYNLLTSPSLLFNLVGVLKDN